MAILANQKVLTLDYWKYANKIKVGDILFNKDGKPVKVKLVQEYRAKTCYEVTFNDHLTISGDDKLIFLLEDEKYRQRVIQYKGVFKFKRPLRQKQLQELAHSPLRGRANRALYSVQTTKPLELPHQTLPVPPFIFGFWFFTKRSTKTMAPTPELEKEILEKFRDHGYKTKKRAKQPNGCYDFSVTPTIESHLAPFIPHKIPNNYLLASAEQRLELLQGILYSESKNYRKRDDTFQFTTKYLALITQVQLLAESLGCKTTLLYHSKKKYYTLRFKTRIQLMSIQNSPKFKVLHNRRFIRNIEPLPSQLCVHIETDGEDSTFLVGEGFIACR
jgi:hypothetical protein